MVNILVGNKEFEQKPTQEIEQKFIPVFPEQLQHLREIALPIEQMYLSHPDEDFSLRVREKTNTDGTQSYSATLKDRGTRTDQGLSRIEIETEISAEAYAFYQAQDLPTLRKLRATPQKNIDIDFYEDGSCRIESEHPLSLSAFLDHQPEPLYLMEAYGDQMNNEWLAHLTYRKEHRGEAVAKPIQPEHEILEVARNIYQHHITRRLVVAAIHGRSGSGKSTLMHNVAEELSGTIPVIHQLSTDDYHRGKTWLETYNNSQPWENWDDAIVYDTEALRRDLESLQAGRPIYQRCFNFTTQEPEIIGLIEPSQERSLILIDGIHANSPHLNSVVHTMHEMTTPLATCIGRRLQRDFGNEQRINGSLPNSEEVLRYLLETAEPTYQQSL